MGQVSTGFESGLGGQWEQFPENRWQCSPEQALSGSYSLYHSFDNTVSGTDRISLETGTFDVNSQISWEFTLRHGYLPSSTNKWQIYLSADKAATESGGSGSINAYVIGVNVSGTDDTLRLYVMQNGKLTSLCSTSLNFETEIGTSAFHCFIKRDPIMGWEIYAAKGSDNLISIGKAKEIIPELPALRYFMLSYSYTSSKDRLLWLDDLSIQANFIVDTIPPKIIQHRLGGRNKVIIELSEEIKMANLRNDQFLLLPENKIPEKVISPGKEISCTFSENFIQRTDYRLVINNLEDKNGNILLTDTVDFFYYDAQKNDLVITEIMADPSPPVYLRETEYIELFSRCEFPLNLDSLILQTGKREWIIPPYTINPGEYLVITSGNEWGYNTIPVFTTSSVITNDGQQILLKNKYDEVISATEFYSDWYGDAFKSEGGWSLERIDANNLCGGKENWKASENYLGGSPGSENSVKATLSDYTSPFIERLEFVSGNKIRLVFSEIIEATTVPTADSFRLRNSSIHPDSLVAADYFCSSLEIVFSDTLQMGIIYEMEIPEGIADCAGNSLDVSEAVRFGLPLSTKLTDVIISEVMYISLPGCSEFMELYNLSDKLLDLSDLRISVGKQDEAGKPMIPLKTPVLFFPGDYFVLCKDKETLLACHTIENPNRLIQTPDLPSLTDDGSCIRLYNRSLEPVDIFCYEPRDEFPMLSDTHGVSLERLELDRKTGDQSYWHSASSLSDFATPGMPNSQSLSNASTQSTIEVTPEVFTPDNNGKDDFAEIQYTLDKEGFVGTVAIFDPTGRMVCLLAENEILGTSGMYLWDGRDANGQVCNTGLYLVYAEIWNLKGERKRFKEVVVLARE
jgi:hypothetical protein